MVCSRKKQQNNKESTIKKIWINSKKKYGNNKFFPQIANSDIQTS